MQSIKNYLRDLINTKDEKVLCPISYKMKKPPKGGFINS